MKSFKIIVVLLCLGLHTSISIAESQATDKRDKEVNTLTCSNTMVRLSGEVLDLARFYFSASHRTDIDASLSTLVKELAKKGYSVNSLSDDDSIRIGVRHYNLGKYSKAYHFATSDGTLWIDIVNYPGVDAITVLKGDQLYSGHYYKMHGRSRWIFHTLNAKENALTAVFHTDTQLVNIGVSLPIKIPDPRKMAQSELRCINTRIDTLYDAVRLVVQHLICDEELAMMPLLPGEQLTAAQRIVGFIRFWSEVKYNFAFFDQVPEINWDSMLYKYLPDVMQEQTDVEYYRLLKKISALLKDGHTNINPPGFVNKVFNKPTIELRNIKRRAIVMNVGTSLQNDLPLGSEITAIDGVPTKAYLEAEVFPYISSSTDHILWDWGVRDLLKGPRDTQITIAYRTLKGKTGKAKVTRNSKGQHDKWVLTKNQQWQRLEFRWLENEIAYVALNTFVDSSIVEEFKGHLQEIQQSKGLVLDIRQNGGGNSGIGNAIIKNLTDRPFLGLTWKTREHRPVFKAWGKFYSEMTPQQLSQLSDEESQLIEKSISYYKGMVWYQDGPDTIQPEEGTKISVPIVVLIGHGTGSAAEDFLLALDSIERATFVGQKTNGSTGQPLMFTLPGGGSARICTVISTYPDGREYVGYGVSPHVHVEPTVEDILNDRDVVLEKAIEILKEKGAVKVPTEASKAGMWQPCTAIF